MGTVGLVYTYRSMIGVYRQLRSHNAAGDDGEVMQNKFDVDGLHTASVPQPADDSGKDHTRRVIYPVSCNKLFDITLLIAYNSGLQVMCTSPDFRA